MSQGAHYRAISVTGLPPSSNNLSRRSSLANSDALPLKPTSSQDLPTDFLSRRPHFPRNYRWLRISAYAGWAVAAILSLTLLLNHPRIAPTVSSLDLGRFGGLRLDTVVTVGDRAAGLRGKVDAELTGMVPSAKELKAAVASKGVKLLPSSGLQAPVSIVSSFYRVDNGKKHRVSGSSLPSLFLAAISTDIHFSQSTTNGSPTSFTLSSFPSFSTVRRRWLPTSKTFAVTRYVFLFAFSRYSR